MPYGVTEQMIETWGDMIFDLSLNIQTRRGDPIRHLDVEAWQAQRDDMGLTDPEIATRTGLATEQVTFIRNISERRRFRLDQYRKLYRLGGGLRYREDRFIDPEEKFVMNDAAVAVRQAISIPPGEAQRFVGEGLWTPLRISNCVERHVTDNGEGIAIRDANTSLTWKGLREQSHRLAASLQAQGLARGDIVVSNQSPGINQVLGYLATLIAGGVWLPLPAETSGAALAACLKRTGARAIICEPSESTQPAELAGMAVESRTLDLVVTTSNGAADGLLSLDDLLTGNDGNPVTGSDAGLAATDPVLLLDNQSGMTVFSHQNLLAAANTTNSELGDTSSASLQWNHDFTTGPGNLVMQLALITGRTLEIKLPTASDQAIKAEQTTVGLVFRTADSGPTEILSNSSLVAGLARHNEESSWTVLDGCQARIVNDQGTPISDGQPGGFQLRGPGLSIGTLVTAHADMTLDGWFRTDLEGTETGRGFSLISR
jgi:hypothetical protein